VTGTPRHFSALARRSVEPPISWLMKAALDRPGLISLAAGFTDHETLPVGEVDRITREILGRPKTARVALQYGSTIGLPQLRHEIARRWLEQDRIGGRRPPVTGDDVIVTNGSQQLLYLVTEVLCDPGDVVLVEDPTYFVYLGIVEALGIRATGFESTSSLESKLGTLKRRRLLPRLKLLYLVTYFQNPTGGTWSLDAKRETLDIVKHYERAAGHPIYIVEDAAYRDLRFEGRDVPSFKTLDSRNERVAYTNTLTKPFATGIKIGYGILPPPLMRAVLHSKGNHDFGSSNFLQAILARALANGWYERHLPTIAAAYRRKRDVMVAAVDAAFDCATCARRGDRRTTCAYKKPHGGLYVWLELDPRVKTGMQSGLFRRALDAGVLYVPGELCYCRDPARPVPRNRIRLSFGAPTIPQIKQGIRLLADALE
jgi:2-aminoadipate transaminase